MVTDTTSQTFFEAKYSNDEDPWNFAANPYELKRYEAIVGALGSHHYHHAFEPGCSIGVLTQRLASLCDRVEATDISPTAVTRAKARCLTLANVEIRCKSLDASTLGEGIDLLVLSEIGYYFDRNQWRILAEQLVGTVVTTGTVLAAHWLGQSDDHLQHGNSVHEVLRSIDSISLEYSEHNKGFRLDRWRKL
jgi:cyclopropane fatty-acyl-phospholipid synthase-like methyltransferase